MGFVGRFKVKWVSKYLKRFKTPQRASQMAFWRYLNSELFGAEARLVGLLEKISGDENAGEIIIKLAEQKESSNKQNRPSNIDLMNLVNDRMKEVNSIIDSIRLEYVKSIDRDDEEKRPKAAPERPQPLYRQIKKEGR